MEQSKIFVPGNLTPPHGFIPVPAYFTDTKWRLASNGVWSGLQFMGVVFIIIVQLAFTPQFIGNDQWSARVISQFLLMALPALGFLIVFVNGGLDLSMGGVAALAGAVAGQTIQAGAPPVVGVMLALGLALVFGLVNGALVGAARLPGLLVTLVTGILVRGLMMGILEGRTIPVGNALAGVPVLGWLMLVLLAAAAFLWTQWPGWNARVPAAVSRFREAWQAGLPYVLSALVAGLFGLAMTNWIQAASPFTGTALEFENAAVMILAGVCLYGRYGNVVGVVLGALALALLRQTMAVAALNIFSQNLVLGVLCLFGLGWLYLYHWIVGLIHRKSTAGKPGAAKAAT